MATKIIENIEFHQIPDFATYYVSLCSKIYSEKRNIILKPHLNKDGYFVTRLQKDGKQYNKSIHRLLAEIFIPNPENKPFIDHKNRIRNDNRLENLHWVTRKENGENQSKRATSLWQGVFYDKSDNRFKAQWRDENSIEHSKSFSVNLYGMFALLMAIDKREEMVAKYYNRPE